MVNTFEFTIKNQKKIITRFQHALYLDRGTRVRRLLISFLLIIGIARTDSHAAEVVGVTVTPHVVADTMRFRRPRDPDLGAHVQLFIKGPWTPDKEPSSLSIQPAFDHKSPDELLKTNEWAWHDLATARSVPDGAMSVWTFNGKSRRWGVGQEFTLDPEGLPSRAVTITDPKHWISAATFLAADGKMAPETIVLHIANDSDDELAISSLRLWLPQDGVNWQTLWPKELIASTTIIRAHERGFLQVQSASPLPLTYAAFELATSGGPIWTHLRIKRETFDISGGWIHDALGSEAYLNLLSHLHVNTGQIQTVAGYTDNPKLYEKYPIKLFNRLTPLDQWDTDQWLPKIHAVEFLGEPQFGGGRPVSPQEVFDQFLPYRSSRLATSVTHSDERTWRYYAKLSDYPHYDAYRVVAPAPDSWRDYDRWGGKRITWGAPLETIGDMCRSLRELNRPMPCAHWSQGPHDGWGQGFMAGFLGGGRTWRSPTPDELRAQAMHALSTRITSLYWFNLSLKSLLRFPDTWESIMRIGREIRMLEPFYLTGDAYQFERRTRADGAPDWDLASIASPDAAILFALDTAYGPDPIANVFKFDAPHEVTFTFRLPEWLRRPSDVFRVDAEGIHEIDWRVEGHSAIIQDQRSRDAIYVATQTPNVRDEIEARRRAAIAWEDSHPVDAAALAKYSD